MATALPAVFGASTIRLDQREANHANARYEGEVSIATGQREGKGTYFYPNPYFTYEGEWLGGKKHGQGRLSFDLGGFYEGEFQDGEITGAGRKAWADGSSYVGQFLEGAHHGEGELQKVDGTSYSGAWFQGRYHGEGDLTLPTGDKYVGSFEKHKYHGEGFLEEKSTGRSYDGQFEAGLRHGAGELKEQGGAAVYTGDFFRGLKHGQGKIEDKASGISYEGPWVEDRPERFAAAWDVGPTDSQDSYLKVAEYLKEEAATQRDAAGSKDKGKKDAKKSPSPVDLNEVGPELRVLKGQALPEIAVRLVDVNQGVITAEVGRRFAVTIYRERRPADWTPNPDDPGEILRRPVNFGDQRPTYVDPLDEGSAPPAKGGKAPAAVEAEDTEEPPSEGVESMSASIGEGGQCIIGGSDEWLIPVHLQSVIYWLRIEDVTEMAEDSSWSRLEPLEMPFKLE
mmetsp:Transcript_24398/g.44196  ORF Transcript_24398/g.44196 Transcript_24398/m.44196 type:complete len:453 (+) Transcript_24398:23-1381(+)|eukprot:CAMPEP_0197621740 /NCGR_PEP_ID=MMETSP1338-20131121/2222_1 /TAXON_ID=43686 ORGANISM="Pelagodinium beii, Strain RCC1491" /NCGR_SAMPLE_ID=MMETSP1338 /ASSEMBLY_ACC=CAM_ASM_000754 /LENGTH=452 /DNA_ID=CAMNT_0043191275 /DNA_START=23 /DNA_END=1381 /DNA_ORIENTATION=-